MRTVLVCLMAAACGGGEDADGGAFPRACDASELDGGCVLYVGSGWSAADVQEDCVDGELLPECPQDGAVGSCTLDPGEFETTTTFYATFWTGSAASTSCASRGGTFDEP